MWLHWLGKCSIFQTRHRQAVSFEYKCRSFQWCIFYLTLETRGSLKVACKFVQNVPSQKTGSCTYANHEMCFLMHSLGSCVPLCWASPDLRAGILALPMGPPTALPHLSSFPLHTSAECYCSHFTDRKVGHCVMKQLNHGHLALKARASQKLPSLSSLV